MNDYVIRFTPREDDVSYEQLVQLVRDAVEDGPEPSGWKILQKGEFDSMAESMSKEKEFVRLVLERERDRPLLSFNGDAEEMKRVIKVTLGNNQFGPFDYVIPDDNCTESMIHDSGKKWISSIYCPDLPEGSITNRSEDSLGGIVIAKIVTHDKNCECKCYGWEEIERKLAAEQREKLKDVFISPEAMEEIRNWGIELKEKVQEYEPTNMVD